MWRVITREEAVQECKGLWRRIKEAGGSKVKYFEDNPKEALKYMANCPLCHYSTQEAYREDRCSITACGLCPLYQQHNLVCTRLGYNEDKCTNEWYEIVENLK